MELAFNKPQRQSKIGILVMFLYTLQKFGRAFFPILVIFFIKIDDVNWLLIIPASIAVLLLLALFAYLSYLNFTFYIDDENEEFIINEGVINKTNTAIKIAKMQQVNIK